jgi:hypothetical protein
VLAATPALFQGFFSRAIFCHRDFFCHPEPARDLRVLAEQSPFTEDPSQARDDKKSVYNAGVMEYYVGCVFATPENSKLRL